MSKLTKEMLLTVPGTPYWCGAQDKLKKRNLNRIGWLAYVQGPIKLFQRAE